MSYLIREHILKIFLLAGIYFLMGKLGLLLAVPPGYATIIWPPSGIAAGALLIYGRHLWPGILLGAFILNLDVSNALPWQEGFTFLKVLVALIIAAGSTLQAFFGRLLIKRFLGLPLSFYHIKQVFLFFLLAGPLACITAATIGVSSLYLSGSIVAENVIINWLTWWTGDMLGVFLFLPLVLVSPRGKDNLIWRGRSLGVLPVLAIIAIIIPIGLTFYAWKIVSENIYQQSLSDFKTLTTESEKALLYKMDSYNNALLGGAGFFQGSEFVSQQEWRSYVDTIDLQRSFPGINGIGYVAYLKPDQVDGYLKKIRTDRKDFEIHPKTSNNLYYITTYLEPVETNYQAIGLNIAFEPHRLEAANLARDTGHSSISKRVILLQDEEKTPGFLLLYPLYKRGVAVNTPEERREALIGWIYAPFIAKNFFQDLTHNQSSNLNIHIYDGVNEDPDALIYTSDESVHGRKTTLFKITKELDVMQQKWLVVWESTLTYEQSMQKEGPVFILVGGLLFTGILAIFLLVFTIRSAETLQWVAEEHKIMIPLVIFCFAAFGSYYLYSSLKEREENYIRSIIEEESNKIQQLIEFQTDDKLTALKRMAQRWVSAKRTPYEQWKDDARNYTDQLNGLRTVEWIDSTYHVKWVYPLKGNEKAVGLNIVFDDSRKRALEGAAEREAVTITPPLDLVQGYKAFIAYMPLKIGQKFDGFIAGIFSIDEFLENVISREVSGKYGVYLLHEGKEFYRNETAGVPLQAKWAAEKIINIYDKKWIIKIAPTKSFVESKISSMPILIFIACLLISALLAVTVRYILISKIKSAYLRNSEETFRSAMEYASIGMALVSLKGRWLRVNSALCKIVGYTEEELLKINFQTITHPEDIEKDWENIRKLLAGRTQNYQMEKRYVRKDGAIVWTNLSVSLALNPDGSPKYFVSQIQDITERREMERMKSEFISVVSHELRTPLTSIKGSLGLIEGTMAHEMPEKANKLISIAYKNAIRLMRLINDILDIEKLSAGKMRFDIEAEILRDLVEQAVETNISYAEKHSISFVIRQITIDTVILADSGRFIQVLSNLLSNAAKFSPAGGVVTINAYEKKDIVRVEIIDQGPGIPEEFKARIFDKFSQSDSVMTRKQGGTGLGLYISKEMIERMNGKIGFDTEIGKGSTFWIEMPVLISENEGKSHG